MWRWTSENIRELKISPSLQTARHSYEGLIEHDWLSSNSLFNPLWKVIYIFSQIWSVFLFPYSNFQMEAFDNRKFSNKQSTVQWSAVVCWDLETEVRGCSCVFTLEKHFIPFSYHFFLIPFVDLSIWLLSLQQFGKTVFQVVSIMAPFTLHDALLLTIVVYCIGNRVTIWVSNQSST